MGRTQIPTWGADEDREDVVLVEGGRAAAVRRRRAVVARIFKLGMVIATYPGAE
jgi:hypothetical protein